MRADICFPKLSGTQLSKGKRAIFFTLYFLLILGMATICAVYAYFTSSARASGNLYFGEISVGLFEDDAQLTDSIFQTRFENVTPGDTLDLSNINIKNTGTHNADVLVNVDVTISANGATSLNYNTWYNVYGEEVNVNDFAVNTTKPTRINKDESATTYIKWQFPGQVLDNKYQGAIADVAVSAFACQTELEEAAEYADKQLYSAYHICKNATEIVETTNSKNLLNIEQDLEWTGVYIYNCNIPAGVYTLSWGSSVLGGGVLPYLRFSNNAQGTNLFTTGGNKTFTFSTDETIIYIYSNGYDYNGSLGVTSSVTNLMLEKGSKATAYETYFDYFYKGAQVSGEPLRKVVTGKNLFDLANRTEGTFDSSTGDKANLREFDFNKYYVGLTVNNYYYTSTLNSYSVTSTAVTVNSKTSGYGVGFPFQVSPNTNYVISSSSTATIGVGYYTIKGENIAYNTNVKTFTTPSNCEIVTIVFRPDTLNADIIYSNIQLELGTTATTYEAYNGVADVVDYTNSIVKRNVVKYEFTGEEQSWLLYSNTSEGISFNYTGFTNKKLGHNTSITNIYENKLSAWAAGSINKEGIYSDHPSNVNVYFRRPIGRDDIDTIEEWKAWVQEQYAMGKPLTIWYMVADGSQSTTGIYASKNLYKGTQNLYNKTGDANSTATQAGALAITKGKAEAITSSSIELGGDLFNYLYNKTFTVSCKIKRNLGDSRTNNRLTVSYCTADQKTHYVSYQTKSNDVPADSQWYYLYVTAQPAAINENAANIEKIVIWLADYSSCPSSDFEVKQLQIEIGNSPTDYRVHDKAAYSYVNGVALRAIGDVKDTYSYNTSTETATITRRIRETVMLGVSKESWFQYQNSETAQGVSFAIDFSAKVTGYKNSKCSYYENIDAAWDEYHKSQMGIYSDHPTANYMYFRAPLGRPDIDTLDKFKVWLQEQNDRGTPVVSWWVAKSSITETI